MPSLSTSLQTGTKTGTVSLSNVKGDFTSPNTFTLAKGQSRFTLIASRDSWADTGSEVASVQADISFDGGLTWQLLCAFTAKGGNMLDAKGAAATESSVAVDAPQPDNPNRMVRVAISAKSNISTSISIKAD